MPGGLGRENLRLPTRKMDLATLAEKICEVHGIHAGELRSGSRRGEIVEAPRVLSRMAVKELGYSGAAVARYLGVTNSCVLGPFQQKRSLRKRNTSENLCTFCTSPYELFALG